MWKDLEFQLRLGIKKGGGVNNDTRVIWFIHYHIILSEVYLLLNEQLAYSKDFWKYVYVCVREDRYQKVLFSKLLNLLIILWHCVICWYYLTFSKDNKFDEQQQF